MRGIHWCKNFHCGPTQWKVMEGVPIFRVWHKKNPVSRPSDNPQKIITYQNIWHNQSWRLGAKKSKNFDIFCVFGKIICLWVASAWPWFRPDENQFRSTKIPAADQERFKDYLKQNPRGIFLIWAQETSSKFKNFQLFSNLIVVNWGCRPFCRGS